MRLRTEQSTSQGGGGEFPSSGQQQSAGVLDDQQQIYVKNAFGTSCYELNQSVSVMPTQTETSILSHSVQPSIWNQALPTSPGIAVTRTYRLDMEEQSNLPPQLWSVPPYYNLAEGQDTRNASYGQQEPQGYHL